MMSGSPPDAPVPPQVERARQEALLRAMRERMTAYEAAQGSFGAQVGRWLTALGERWAAPGTFRRRVGAGLARAFRALHRDGLVPFLRRAGRKILGPSGWSDLAQAETGLVGESHLFDVEHYRRCHPHVVRAGLDPIRHFVLSGWREGRSPHPLFDVSYYLETNPDVQRAGVNPLVHFITTGWREGRCPHPLFDVAHYLDAHPDVERAGVNPLAHFVTSGWREGRSPHPLFDTAYYLGANPDVALEGLNPLAHFVAQGMREGRVPCPGLDLELALPLPDFAWQPGDTRIERFLRTFVYTRRSPLADSDVETWTREINALAAAQDRLPRPEASECAASVIIPVFNQLKFTLWCLHAILSGSYRCSFEIVVVDDGSQDRTLEVLRRLPLVRHVHSAGNGGFVRSCNRGAEVARGGHLVFLNNDTLPLQGWLDALVDTFRDRPQAGAVGGKLISPDGRLQEAGGIVWQGGAATNYGRGSDRTRPEFNYLRSVDYCSGAALAVPADLFRDAGGFDVSLSPAYGEDLDLALRLRERGHPALYQPFSEVVHLEGVTAGTSTRQGVKAAQVRNLETLSERWRLLLRSHRPEGNDTRFEKDRDAERRVLFVDAFTMTPDQDAGSLDGLHWLQSLQALGYQTTYVPYFDFRHAGRYTSDLQRLGVECVYAPHYATPEDFLVEHGAEFDLCVFYRFHVADAILPAVERFAPQAKRLLALCDLHHVRTHREATLEGSASGLRASYEDKFRELFACARCDALWTPSAFEKEVLQKELPGADVFVWPLAQELRPPRKAYAERAGIGYLGGYKHLPNVDTVLYFIDAILPRVLEEEPDMTFVVAGSAMPPEVSGIDHPAVKVLGHVEDLRTFFEELRVFVAPIRYGAGVKGKVVASLASGVPVVGTSMAVEGMGLGPEEGAIVADTPEEFARQIVRVHRSERLWSRLSRAGFERAEREYSVAAGTGHLAEAVVKLGVGTRRAYELIQGATPRAWLDLPGMEIDVCRTQAEHRALRESDAFRRRVALEEELLQSAENGQLRHRGYSLPARRPVVFRADVLTDAAGKPQARWREDLFCPITGLNNRQRAIAAFAEGLLVSRDLGIRDVYLTEQVTPLYKWMAARFRTVSVLGSEYLGREARSGEVRDGLQHQDVERLGFDGASLDLVVSGDVLEHVDDPRKALAEFARVLRPGGHLLFTVPFWWETEKNRRRARARDGSVEHLVDPCYHGDPMNPAGSLAFFDFGWELLDWVSGAGFRDVSALCYWSAALGHLGEVQVIFYARLPV